MAKQRAPNHQGSQSTSQLGLAYPTKVAVDPRHKASVVTLLARLLLQVASANRRNEVDDDAP
jgi:hypothetical protein